MELKNKVVCFLGDSITEGCGTTDKKSKVFHALIAARNNMTARGYGISGTRFAKQHVPTEGKPNHDRDFCQRVEQMEKDAQFVIAFTDRMANAKRCPVAREMPDNMKEKLDIYLARKRDKK